MISVETLGDGAFGPQIGDARGATVVFGGQVGSEGKGAIVGYLARRYRYQLAICTFMTNAGHTWLGEDGEKVVVQQLPVSLVSPATRVLALAPTSAITLDQLEKELNAYDQKYDICSRLAIDPRCVIIDEAHSQLEQQITKRIGSTMKGCGAAVAMKALRHPEVRLARDIPWLRPYLSDTVALANCAAQRGMGIMVEGSQGFDLDINHGLEYPQCTSRQCTPQQTLADCGLDPSFVTRSVAVIRSFPIRVGNIEENGLRVGHSGSFGGRELTWAEVTELSGSPVPLEERTTVTQRVRRVFEIDYERLGRMAMVCRPTDIAFTFADYIDHALTGATSYYDRDGDVLSHKLDRELSIIEGAVAGWPRANGHAARVSLCKTGPRDNDMIDMLETDWAVQ